MAEATVFDTLVAALSSSERRDMLERIRTAAKVGTEPFFAPEALPQPPTATEESRLAGVGIFGRVILFFRRLFTGKSYIELIVQDELGALAATIENRHPGLIDAKAGLLLEGFAEQLRSLRDAARFFKELLARSVEGDKGAFVAFLISLSLPEVASRLETETDPFARADGGVPPAEIRQSVLEAFEEILRSLTDEGRRAMYSDLRSLLFLRRLSGFLFDRLLGLFRPHASGVIAAPFKEARDLVLELGDLLFSMSVPPSTELLEALFVVAERDEFDKGDFDAEASLTSDIAAGAAAIQKVRSFNSRVPLGNIIRMLSEDPDCMPRDLPGGEDWFAILRAFWKERIEARLEDYRLESRNHELATEIAEFIGNVDISPFAHMKRDGLPGSPPMRHELALTLLEGFWQGPFHKEINRPLKIVLVDGDFYRKDNRIEFTDAYGELLRIHERLLALDLLVSPEGDIGKTWNQASTEMLAIPFKRRKLDTIRRGAEDEAEKVILGVAEALGKMARIIKGVLKGEAGGRYDSLQNLSSLDRRSNREFLRSLETVRNRCESAHRLLGEITGLDLGKSE